MTEEPLSKSAVNSKKLCVDSKKPSIEVKKSGLDLKKPALDLKKSAVDSKKSAVDGKKSGGESKKPPADPKKSSADSKKFTVKDSEKSDVRSKTLSQSKSAPKLSPSKFSPLKYSPLKSPAKVLPLKSPLKFSPLKSPSFDAKVLSTSDPCGKNFQSSSASKGWVDFSPYKCHSDLVSNQGSDSGSLNENPPQHDIVDEEEPKRSFRRTSRTASTKKQVCFILSSETLPFTNAHECIFII